MEQARRACALLTSHCCQFPFFFFFFFLNKPIKSDRPVAVSGSLSTPLCRSLPFMRFTGSSAPHLSPQTLLLFLGSRGAGVSSSWFFFFARSLPVLSAAARQIKAAQSKRLAALLPSKGKPESSLVPNWEPGSRSEIVHV